MSGLERFRHPAWTTSLATLLAYGLILLVIAILLFGVPFVIVSAL